jgi:hypothetical protein
MQSDSVIPRASRQKLASLGIKFLWALFIAVLALRFFFPFLVSPLDNIDSDSHRHWTSGEFFLTPLLWGSLDPFFYQLWMWFIRSVSGNDREWIQAFTGLICMGMALGWFLTLRELVSTGYALSGAIVLGLMPAMLGQYAFFMSETILLTTMSIATWLTVRAFRVRTLPAYGFAILFWMCAVFSRLSALPAAAVCIALLWYFSSRKVSIALMSAIMFLALAVPAARHAHVNLNIYDPFGYGRVFNQTYRASPNATIELYYKDEWHFFYTPAFVNPIFAPFPEYKSLRHGSFIIHVDAAHGRADWEAALERAQKAPRDYAGWIDWYENAVGMLFGTVWPADLIWQWEFYQWVNGSRWLVVPMVVMVVVGLCFRRLPWRSFLIPGLGLLLMFMVLVQNRGVGEGRFRMPADPYIIASLFILAHRHHLNRKASQISEHDAA